MPPDTSQCITCYDSLKLVKFAQPVVVENPKTHLLTLISKEYRLVGKLVPYTDSSGITYPLD